MSSTEIPPSQPAEQILGVDPKVVSDTPLPAATEQDSTTLPGGIEPEASKPPSGPSAEQLAQWQEKAKLYDLIESEPQLVDMIDKHFKVASTQQDTPKITPPSNTPPTDYVSRREFQEMRNLNQQLFSQLQVMQFAQEHNDFGTYRAKMGELITKHPTMSLNEAYDWAKTTAPRSNGNAAKSANLHTPEVRNSRPIQTEQSGLDEIRSKIQDPKATRSMKDALRLAWNHALAQESSKEE